MMAKYDAANPAALKRLVAGGAQLRPFPQPVMEACFKAANELYAETAAANADFKKVLDSLTAFRSDQYLWWQVAEYGFDCFMIRVAPAHLKLQVRINKPRSRKAPGFFLRGLHRIWDGPPKSSGGKSGCCSMLILMVAGSTPAPLSITNSRDRSRPTRSG